MIQSVPEMFFKYVSKNEIVLMINYWERTLNVMYKRWGILTFSK